MINPWHVVVLLLWIVGLGIAWLGIFGSSVDTELAGLALVAIPCLLPNRWLRRRR